jgi:hypothetical protein
MMMPPMSMSPAPKLPNPASPAMPVLPTAPLPAPDFAKQAKGGDLEPLIVDALRGMKAAADKAGLDFDGLIQKALKPAGTLESSAPPNKEPILGGLGSDIPSPR